MKNNFDKCMNLLFANEGVISNNRHDTGGLTKYGITEKSWIAYKKNSFQQSNISISKITKEAAKKFYKKEFWNKLKCDNLPVGIDYLLFDASVNSGRSQAIKWIQRVLLIADDGIIGKETLKSINASLLRRSTCMEFTLRRRLFVRSLDTYGVFGAGWEKRINLVNDDAIRMINEAAI